MKLKHLFYLFVIFCFLPSCKTTLPTYESLMEMVTPNASPEQVADIMEMAEKAQFKSPKKLWKSKKNRIKIKKGQWVTTLTKYKSTGNDVVLSTTKVISASRKAVVLETEKYSALEDGVVGITQMTIENYPLKSKVSYTEEEYNKLVNNMKITKIITKQGNNPPEEMPAQALEYSQQMTKNMTVVAFRTGNLIKTKYSTPYIKSSRCYEYNFSVAAMGITSTGNVVAHSSVPINGLVKMDTEDISEETIAFGTKGAKSAL